VSEIIDGWGDRRVMAVVAQLVDEAWTVIEPNLRGLSDAEYFWEPVPGCWGVRRRGDVAAPACWGKGEWAVEISLDGQVAPALTTIGWRLMHAYDCTNDFTLRAFGGGGADWNDIEVPGTGAGAVALMTAAIDQLRDLLARSTDDVLLGVGGDGDERGRGLLLAKGLLEGIHHCAEVGVLRDLFRAQGRP
jgi:hypothetical protein